MLPSFDSFDLTKENCFNFDEKSIMEMLPVSDTYTEADFIDMPIDLLFENDGYSAILTPTSISTLLPEQEAEYLMTYTHEQTLTELGIYNGPCNDDQIADEATEAHENLKVIVEPVYKPLSFSREEVTVKEFTESYLLTPPESVCSDRSDDESKRDENIIIVCSDKKTKISIAEFNQIKNDISQVEQLIKPPSRRGRPKRKIEELEKETNVQDEKRLKVAKNNLASNKYRTKKSEERRNLDNDLACELARFKELQLIHERLQTEIRQLQLLQFASIQ